MSEAARRLAFPRTRRGRRVQLGFDVVILVDWVLIATGVLGSIALWRVLCGASAVFWVVGPLRQHIAVYRLRGGRS